MVYSARFEVAAANVEEAMNRMTVAVENGGGYLEMREDSRVVCRIPAGRFQQFVALMPTFGSVVSQTIRNQDVTRDYHDLNLHIETAEWSRQRVLRLMDRAEKIEDILKLEEELLRLTATIEGLKGTLKDLSEQIAYSKVEVNFRPNAPQSKLDQPGAPSPFAWINRLGVEQVIGGFGSIDTEEKLNIPTASALLPGGISIGPLEGFIVVKEDRAELKAITPDSSKLWIREFDVPQRGNLTFWHKAVKADLLEHRGYELVDEQSVRDAKNNEGVQMTSDVAVGGTTHRYLVALFVSDGPFWQSGNTVRTVEFAAPLPKFDKYVADVRLACGWNGNVSSE